MKFFGLMKGAAVLIGCLFVFGLLYFTGRHTERPRVTGATLGSVSELVGEAEIRLPQSMTFEKLQDGAQLLSGELIVVHEASQVTLGFGGASLRLQPGARFVVERDTSKGAGAIRGTLLDGDADLLTTSSDFVLVKNGKEINGSTASTSPALVTKTQASGSNVVIAATTPIETPTPVMTPVARANDETDATSRDSLSNEEIRRALGAQAGFYRRCYLTYLNRAKPEKTEGETVTVGFVLSNNGHVRDAHIVRSTVTDATLTKCVLETVGRTPFRAFKAAEIPVLEFPIELK